MDMLPRKRNTCVVPHGISDFQRQMIADMEGAVARPPKMILISRCLSLSL
jgi:hypothetical protein